jgi:5-methylcytosine-specific restriction endonuclease McrA
MNIKEKFLQLAVVKQMKYEDIEEELGILRAEFSPWWNELKEERLVLTEIRDLRNRKCPDVNFQEFKEWFDSKGRVCHYCKISQEEFNQLWDVKSEEQLTKRLRGRKLEVERLRPNDDYTLDNMVACCYWCNNAKTDTFTEKEFLKVGKVFGEVWKARLAKL